MPRHTVKKIVPVQVLQLHNMASLFTDKKDMKICQIFGPIFYSES